MADLVLPFLGGSASARQKLNLMADMINTLDKVRGDEVFIAIRRTPGGGAVISLNINQVLSRIPKMGGSAELFPVRIMRDGGGNGTQTTPASWTYTVWDLNGTSLGSGITLATPRPVGQSVFQGMAGSVGDFPGDGFGLATYFDSGSGSTLELLDAYEIPAPVSCVTP